MSMKHHLENKVRRSLPAEVGNGQAAALAVPKRSKGVSCRAERK